MGEAGARAAQLVSAIDAALGTYVGSEIVPPMFPEEAKAATPQDLRYLQRVLRATTRAQRIFEADMHRAFLELGSQVAAAWRSIKQGDDVTVELVLNRADLRGFRKAQLERAFQHLYQLTGEATFAAVSERIGIAVGWNLEDRRAQEVVAAGGRRLGLVDLEDSTRLALFAAITEAREQGLGADALARRIRQYVPAGRFTALEREREGRGVAYRAKMIARTETTYARNISALAAGQEAGFEHYLVFDARIGPTDSRCEALNGQVVTADQASQLLEEEHPNGTRSVSPVPRSQAPAKPPQPGPAPAPAPATSEAEYGRVLTDAERASVKTYQENSDTVNPDLRAGAKLSAYQQKLVDDVDAAIAKGALPNDTLLYRGMALSDAKLAAMRAAGALADDGFGSTTLDEMIANGFAQEGGLETDNSVMLLIRAKAGQRGAYVDAVNSPDEQYGQSEFLLARGTRLIIDSVRETGVQEYEVEAHIGD